MELFYLFLTFSWIWRIKEVRAYPFALGDYWEWGPHAGVRTATDSHNILVISDNGDDYEMLIRYRSAEVGQNSDHGWWRYYCFIQKVDGMGPNVLMNPLPQSPDAFSSTDYTCANWEYCDYKTQFCKACPKGRYARAYSQFFRR
jgi:hypothetical protein